MTSLLIQAVNLSISASYLVVAILALRFLLKKAPKWVNMTLWGIVGLRLLLPFSIESVLSHLPSGLRRSGGQKTHHLHFELQKAGLLDRGGGSGGLRGFGDFLSDGSRGR